MLRSAVILSLLVSPAFADAPRSPKMPPPAREPHVSAYGAQHGACLEWTDSCQVCTREIADGKPGAIHCSTPGIACTPAKPACLRDAPPQGR